MCCTCSAHVSWLVYLIHDCGCCDFRGQTSIKQENTKYQLLWFRSCQPIHFTLSRAKQCIKNCYGLNLNV